MEEARKSGQAEAAQDEDGRDINPHIPQYISAAPWYYQTTGPTLKHQRPQEDKQREYSSIGEWYKRGVDTSKVATKFRKGEYSTNHNFSKNLTLFSDNFLGACENCGAMTHIRKDCMERPRKKAAKFSGALIAYDEFVQPDLKPDFDGKRDRWAGYDPNNHREIVEEYQKIEEAKRQMRAEKLKEDPNAEDSEEEDGDKYADEIDMPGTKVDSKQRITVRNLRIREDTAKYLRNLDPNSAYYDPKTRSMRDNPDPKKQAEEVEFAGENFVRFSGDTQKHAVAQLFAWDAHGKGVDVHVLAEPTKLELLQKEYEKKKDEFKDSVKDNVLQKYGGEEHLQVPPKSLLLAQTETYIEYARDGRIIKGQEKSIIRSRYEEDVVHNNHTTSWGSYWNQGQWGFKCCHSFIKNSWCCKSVIGAEAEIDKSIPQIEAFSKHVDEVPDRELEKEKSLPPPPVSESSSSSEEESSKKSKKSKSERKKDKKKKRKRKQKEKKEGKAIKDKLQVALDAEDKHNKHFDDMMSMDERKRSYNSMYDAKAPTEEQMEAYQMKRSREEDPMMQFMSKKKKE